MKGKTKEQFKQFCARWRAFCIYVDSRNRRFFFTTDHCQRVCAGAKPISEDFVSVTNYLPIVITPRPSCPSGVVSDLETYLKIFHAGEWEIQNPDSNFQISREEIKQILEA